MFGLRAKLACSPVCCVWIELHNIASWKSEGLIWVRHVYVGKAQEQNWDMCSSTGLSTYLFTGFYLCVAQGSVTGCLIALIYLIFAVLDRYHLLCLPDFRLVKLLYSITQLCNNTRVFFVSIYLSYAIELLRFLGVNYRRTKWEESLLLELHGTQPLHTSHIYNSDLWQHWLCWVWDASNNIHLKNIIGIQWDNLYNNPGVILLTDDWQS